MKKTTPHRKLSRRTITLDGQPLLIALKSAEDGPSREDGPLTPKMAREICGGLSYPSKMPCAAYSIPAHNCHTGTKLRAVPGSTCQVCYAMRGNFLWPNTRAAMDRRLRSLTHPRWVEAMVCLIKDEGNPFFRWHDSGDLQSVDHLDKICQVATVLPWVSFWLPTREPGIVNTYLANGGSIPGNLTVRLSAYFVDAPPSLTLAAKFGGTCSTVTRDPAAATCRAFKQGNKCQDCRLCWDKKTANVAYLAH